MSKKYTVIQPLIFALLLVFGVSGCQFGRRDTSAIRDEPTTTATSEDSNKKQDTEIAANALSSDLVVCPDAGNEIICQPSVDSNGDKLIGGKGIKRAILDVETGHAVVLKVGRYRADSAMSCPLPEQEFTNSYRSVLVTNCLVTDKAFTLKIEPGVILDGEDGIAQQAVLWTGSGSTLAIDGMTIADFPRGAVVSHSGAIVNISNSVIVDNGSDGSSALYAYDAELNVDSTIIANNGWGGIHFRQSTGSITGSTFYANGAATETTLGYSSSAISVSDDSAVSEISGNIIGRHTYLVNYAGYGAISCSSVNMGSGSVTVLKDNLVFNNESDVDPSCNNTRFNLPIYEWVPGQLLSPFDYRFVSPLDNPDTNACSYLTNSAQRKALSWGALPEEPETFCD